MSFIIILEDECKGCQLCVPTCKFGLIRHTNNRVNKQGVFPVEFADPKGECNACMLCAIVCPDVAIRVYREVKRKEPVEKARESIDEIKAGVALSQEAEKEEH